MTRDETFFGLCSSRNLHLLAETVIKCEDFILLDTVVTKWIKRIQRLEAPCVPAIITADTLHIVRLGGAACYVHLQEVAEHSTTVSEEGATRFHMDPKLDVAQKAKLLSGFWSLVRYWEHFRRFPAKILSCRHADCIGIWERCWIVARDSREILCTSQADVLGLIKMMQDLLKADVELLRMPDKCREESLKALGEAWEELNESLGDHFTDSL
ncbi:hypothetical protein BT96DRAFT_268258 [Gymnopus androsaceus JB14]|uniref:Uncharacterized protein n=1 Tax=Gymnopus androsaceus JB14 TaxID=1447944 RepID=A0A6A4I8U6_9AGAR|nr:hypothetical protein BT96DRAFT_268258 [Gymnopus androsaceus JB14]